MRYHSQNLSDGKSPMFLWGRAWLGRFRWEWSTFHKARGFAVTLGFGQGDNDDGLCFHFCIPFIISLFLSIGGVFRCKSCKTGVAIHNQAIWFYVLPFDMESNSRDPWYRKNYSVNFPWQLDWYSTEILTQHTPQLAKVVYTERRGDRKRLGLDAFEIMQIRNGAEEDVSETHDYTYTLKSGEVQNRKATIYVDRMTWKARWWPIIPIKKVRTSINVKFNAEVGEETGTWKGGCTGCGYDMMPFETPWECLRRMERERKFAR